MPKIIEFLGYDPFPEPTPLGEQLKRYRLINELTQRELAKRLKVSPDTVRSWEKSRNEPTGRSFKVLREFGFQSTPSHIE